MRPFAHIAGVSPRGVREAHPRRRPRPHPARDGARGGRAPWRHGRPYNGHARSPRPAPLRGREARRGPPRGRGGGRRGDGGERGSRARLGQRGSGVGERQAREAREARAGARARLPGRGTRVRSGRGGRGPAAPRSRGAPLHPPRGELPCPPSTPNSRRGCPCGSDTRQAHEACADRAPAVSQVEGPDSNTTIENAVAAFVALKKEGSDDDHFRVADLLARKARARARSPDTPG